MQALYDLSPLAQLLLLALALALAPLFWIWLRHRRATVAQRLRALTLLTLFLSFDLVMFGAFTRLTDSGLGCPDWPGCYGNASPIGANAAIAAAQNAQPNGPVTHGKAWIEMVHRYLATSIGVLIAVLAVAPWLGRARGARPPATSRWWPALTLLWVCMQGAFGALTVTMKLFPAIVTLHLLGGVLLLVLLCLQLVRSDMLAPVAVIGALRWLLAGSLALLLAQITLGGWVSANYAVLACNDFPKCQNSWWPSMDFDQGFALWRELGVTPTGEHINLAALTAIHYAHRLLAYLVLPLLGLLAWQLKTVPALRTAALWIGALTALQLATGLSNVVLDWPLLAAVLHTGGAAALLVAITWSMAVCRRS